MNPILIALAQFLIIGLNVTVSEGAPSSIPVGSVRLTVPCGNTNDLTDSLERKYKERVVFKGVAKSGIMKFYANDLTSTFTVAYETGGMTCILMAGNFLIKETQGTPL